LRFSAVRESSEGETFTAMREHDGNDVRKLHIPLKGKMPIARAHAHLAFRKSKSARTQRSAGGTRF